MASYSEKVAAVVARAWTDPQYHERLRRDPKGTLAEAGIPTRDTVKLHEDSDSVTHFVLPRRPPHIRDQDLSSDKPHPDLCCFCAV
jgi:hypothetical protein